MTDDQPDDGFNATSDRFGAPWPAIGATALDLRIDMEQTPW